MNMKIPSSSPSSNFEEVWSTALKDVEKEPVKSANFEEAQIPPLEGVEKEPVKSDLLNSTSSNLNESLFSSLKSVSEQEMEQSAFQQTVESEYGEKIDFLKNKIKDISSIEKNLKKGTLGNSTFDISEKQDMILVKKEGLITDQESLAWRSGTLSKISVNATELALKKAKIAGELQGFVQDKQTLASKETQKTEKIIRALEFISRLIRSLNSVMQKIAQSATV